MARHPSNNLIESTALREEDAPGLPALRDAANAIAIEHAQRQTAARAVAQQLGYQLPADCTDPDLIQRDISANMRRSVEACLEVGRGLRVLKEACVHGEFIDRLDALGIDRKVAAKFMQSAAKFGNVSSTRHLTAAIGNQTKLFEMLVLDDEQIEELELTGQTGELKLDDVATMSVKELRAKLREARESAQAKDRLMADKNQKIDELAQKLVQKRSAIETADPDPKGEQLRADVAHLGFQAEAAIRGALRLGIEALIAHGEAHEMSHEDFIAGQLCQIELALNQVRGQYGIKTKPDGDEFPWLRAVGAEG